MQCVECLIDRVQDARFCTSCGRPLHRPFDRVPQNDQVHPPVPAETGFVTGKTPDGDGTHGCRLCGGPAEAPGPFCTTCYLMVVNGLDDLVESPHGALDDQSRPQDPTHTGQEAETATDTGQPRGAAAVDEAQPPADEPRVEAEGWQPPAAVAGNAAGPAGEAAWPDEPRSEEPALASSAGFGGIEKVTGIGATCDTFPKLESWWVPGLPVDCDVVAGGEQHTPDAPAAAITANTATALTAEASSAFAPSSGATAEPALESWWVPLAGPPQSWPPHADAAVALAMEEWPVEPAAASRLAPVPCADPQVQPSDQHLAAPADAEPPCLSALATAAPPAVAVGAELHIEAEKRPSLPEPGSSSHAAWTDPVLAALEAERSLPQPWWAPRAEASSTSATTGADALNTTGAVTATCDATVTATTTPTETTPSATVAAPASPRPAARPPGVAPTPPARPHAADVRKVPLQARARAAVPARVPGPIVRPALRQASTRPAVQVAALVAILLGSAYAAYGPAPDIHGLWSSLRSSAPPLLPSTPIAVGVHPAGPLPLRLDAPVLAPETTTQGSDGGPRVPTTRPVARAGSPTGSAGSTSGNGARVKPSPSRRQTSSAAGRRDSARADVKSVTMPVKEGEPAPLPAAPVPVAAVQPRTEAVPAIGRAFEMSEVDVRPLVASRVEPRYPAGADQRGLEDVVILRVLVSATGQPRDVRLLRPSSVDASFDGAAVAAVRQWSFAPARKSNRAVDCWLNVGVPFRRTRELLGSR